jgi:hypothetical protein
MRRRLRSPPGQLDRDTRRRRQRRLGEQEPDREQPAGHAGAAESPRSSQMSAAMLNAIEAVKQNRREQPVRPVARDADRVERQLVGPGRDHLQMMVVCTRIECRPRFAERARRLRPRRAWPHGRISELWESRRHLARPGSVRARRPAEPRRSTRARPAPGSRRGNCARLRPGARARTRVRGAGRARLRR